AFRQLDDEGVMGRIATLTEQGRDDLVVDEIMGPTFDYIRKHSDTLKQGIAAEIDEIIKGQIPDEGHRKAAVSEIVEGLPTVMPHSALGESALNQVIEHLRSKGSELEQLSKFKAMLGASPGILHGTYDSLKAAAKDKPPFIKKG